MSKPRKKVQYGSFITRYGNPSGLVDNSPGTAEDAKMKMKRRVRDFRAWAHRFNLALETRCDDALTAIDLCNLHDIPTGQTRRWELTDEHTGVTLVVEVEKT